MVARHAPVQPRPLSAGHGRSEFHRFSRPDRDALISGRAVFPPHCAAPRGKRRTTVIIPAGSPVISRSASSSRFRHLSADGGARFARARRGRQSQVGTMAPSRSGPTQVARPIGVLTGAGDSAGTAARFRSQALTPRRARSARARVLRELPILCIAFFVLSIRCARDGGCFRSSRPAGLSDHNTQDC